MSKLIAAGVAVSGVSAAVIGGTYIMNKGNETEEKESRQENEDKVSPELKFSTLDEFKSKKGYKCSESVFSDNFELGNLDRISQFSKGSPADTDYFGAPVTGDEKIKSCLIINWEKKTYKGESNKWSGTFTWTWSFVNDTKGFIVTNIAKTGQGTEKLKLTGGAYLLEKKTEGGVDTWEVKYMKEVTTDKDFDDSLFEGKFPKVKEGSGVTIDTGDYWGFMTSKEDLKNICASCTDTGDNREIARKLEEFKWTHQSGSDKNIAGWSDNLNWWDEMFEKSSFDLENKLGSFKGNWFKASDVTVPQESQ